MEIELIINKEKEKIIISVDDDFIDVTFLKGNEQTDFSIEKENWETVKNFIDNQLSLKQLK